MMKTKHLRTVGGFFCLWLMCCNVLSNESANPQTLTIAVASNFLNTLKTLTPIYEQQSGHKLIVSSASTGQLFQQIIHGAPFDVLLAANHEQPEQLFSQLKNHRQLPTNALQPYSQGRLVLLASTAIENDISVSDLLNTALAHKYKIALANPKLAPYGLAAQQTLQSLQFFKPLKKQLVMGQNVAQAYQFVHTGNAQLGFFALSQVQNLATNRYRIIADTLHQPIIQTALQLNNKTSSQDFMLFLLSPASQKIIANAGYLPVNYPPNLSNKPQP